MKILNCRSCKSKKLDKLFSLGNLFYTGIFPKKIKSTVPKGELKLVICKFCKLVQLESNFSSKKMYGANYGYRTSLNRSMKKHITGKKKLLSNFIKLKKNDIILDIGSNDGTFLNSFNQKKFKLIGIDPTIKKFSKFYKKKIIKCSNFFSYNSFNNIFRNQKAKLITSFSMFYDLKDPVKFSNDIYKILDDQGLWHFEQSYLIDMIKKNSYDTICHEHLEYYSIHSINFIMKKTHFKIIDIKKNDINGGSIALTVAKEKSKYAECTKILKHYLKFEQRFGHDKKKTYIEFFKNILKQKEKLLTLLNKIKRDGKKIIGYGASTKGNVLLQWCGIDNKLIDYIYDINKDKNNKFTPGTLIPIYSKIKKINSDLNFFLVLPWHFKNFILKKENATLNNKKKLIFPLPTLSINK